ncbi:MAG: hypothetical protein IT550_15090 [Novosphingobium sp.]|nr:hypothetical protein [Novosphingobium sp.]
MPARKKTIAIAAVATIAVGAAVAVPLIAQQRAASGPVARYDMRAGTVSGMAGMGGGMGAGLGMMFGGGRGGNVQHELYLRLGSSRAADRGSPKADHFMPSNAKLGKSVALVTPREERGGTDEMPQKPQGRLLIYWGCGEHAPKGQPVVIDFARVAAGHVPPGVFSSTVVRDWGPTIGNSRTFGRWPAEDGKFVKSDSSLIGPHRIAANYAPEISFTLARDFMRALSVNTSSLPSGASMVRWGGIPDATGYYVMLFGGKQGQGDQMRDMVMWSSSASRQFGGGLSDWISPGQVAALVRDRTVLPPSATSCTVPAEVIRDAPDFRFGTLNAYGPEESFSYPPRPADPRAAWNLEWTARVRHRSTTSWMQAQGMSMGTGGGQQGQGQQQQNCRPRGLGGMLGGALGGGRGGC